VEITLCLALPVGVDAFVSAATTVVFFQYLPPRACEGVTRDPQIRDGNPYAETRGITLGEVRLSLGQPARSNALSVGGCGCLAAKLATGSVPQAATAPQHPARLALSDV